MLGCLLFRKKKKITQTYHTHTFIHFNNSCNHNNVREMRNSNIECFHRIKLIIIIIIFIFIIIIIINIVIIIIINFIHRHRLLCSLSNAIHIVYIATYYYFFVLLKYFEPLNEYRKKNNNNLKCYCFSSLKQTSPIENVDVDVADAIINIIVILVQNFTVRIYRSISCEMIFKIFSHIFLMLLLLLLRLSFRFP